MSEALAGQWRQAFKQGINRANDGDVMSHDELELNAMVDVAWNAYRQGRRAGLEEAAEVCDAEEDSCREACRDAEPDEVGSEFINELRGGQAAVGSCAMKIRALAEKEGAGT